MLRRALLVSAVTLVSATASAHIALDSPSARDGAMKTPPCGGASQPGVSPTTFRPGQTVTLRWHETVEHPGFFRIAFSPDGSTFPQDPPDPPPAAAFPVLAIIPKMAGVTSYSADITLPDMECAGCALQVIQYMQQHAPPPYYYQCADIVLSNDAPTGGSGGSGGASGTSGATGTTAEPGSVEESGCGCRVPRRSTSSALGVAVASALLLAFARRRRARNARS